MPKKTNKKQKTKKPLITLYINKNSKNYQKNKKCFFKCKITKK